METQRPMALHFKLEYWKDGQWYVGRLTQVPGVFSQGATLEELEENIRDAYRIDARLAESAAAGRIGSDQGKRDPGVKRRERQPTLTHRNVSLLTWTVLASRPAL